MSNAHFSSSERAAMPKDRRPRVLILGDPDKEESPRLAESLRAQLAPRADVVGVELARAETTISAPLDLLIVIGGDGALLAATHRLNGARVPVMGVNVGTVGFLAAVAPARALAMLDLVLAGEAPVEDRTMLAFEVIRADAEPERGHVLNDLVLARAQERSLSEVELLDEGRWVCSFRGDGVIVSTATGSTAYNLAAGGPIISPRLDAVVLCPLAPYALAMRPLVLPSERQFELRARSA
ncbi:MAG: NAD(+)/NADH kinase, partial [Planctomycetota bacterium]|nr:NAD(+)/NADH kinase [Planctomycetota bacterium]